MNMEVEKLCFVTFTAVSMALDLTEENIVS